MSDNQQQPYGSDSGQNTAPEAPQNPAYGSQTPNYGTSSQQQPGYAAPQPQQYGQPQYGQPQYGQPAGNYTQPQYGQPAGGYTQQPGYSYPPQQPGYAPQQPGYAPQYGNPGYSAKSKVGAGLLGIFLGSLGVHNFYLGYTGKAVAQLLLTLLLWWALGLGPLIAGIWGLVEGILILCSQYGSPWHKDANGYELTE